MELELTWHLQPLAPWPFPGAKRANRLDNLHYKCIISTYELTICQSLTGAGANKSGLGVSGRGPDRAAPVGKTTLLRHLFEGRYRYVSLEPPDVRVAAAEDPRGFLELCPAPVIFDEVQYAPICFPTSRRRSTQTVPGAVSIC